MYDAKKKMYFTILQWRKPGAEFGGDGKILRGPG